MVEIVELVEMVVELVEVALVFKVLFEATLKHQFYKLFANLVYLVFEHLSYIRKPFEPLSVVVE